MVDHGATRTTYEPVDGRRCASATRWPPGTSIGRLQLVGSHCFPRACLHWGLIEGREHYLDPLTLVGAGPVRLLPLGGPGHSAGLGTGPGALAQPRPTRRGCSWLRTAVRVRPPGQARGWACR